VLKERRRLVLGLRESPLSSIVLENCLKLARAGALIAPLSPPFYTHPKTLEDTVRDMTDKLLAAAGFPAGSPWRGGEL
ncbi:MAG: flavoprotein, partial [bacterium]